jgi:hypothetical protein
VISPGARFLRMETDQRGRQVAVIALDIANVTTIHRLVLRDLDCVESCSNCHGCRCAKPCPDEPRCGCTPLFGIDPATTHGGTA